MGQICFDLIKMGSFTSSSTSEYISREYVQNYIEKFLSQNEQLVHSFYAKTEFDPRLPIKREDFLQVFKKVQMTPLFAWVPRLVDGYNEADCLNVDESQQFMSAENRRLTVIQKERERKEAEQMGFTREEHDNMQEWYNYEIKGSHSGRDVAKAIATVEKMFKDIKNEKLRQYMADGLTKHVKIAPLPLITFIESPRFQVSRKPRLRRLHGAK